MAATPTSSTRAVTSSSSSTVQVSSGTSVIPVAGGKQVLVFSGGLPITQPLQILGHTKSEREEAVKRREILARQPSYCKILNDLKEAESSESEDSVDHKNIIMKGENIDIDQSSTTQGQTVVINGQQYQIVSPSAMDNVLSLQTGGFSSSNGGTVFLPSSASPPGISGGGGSSPGGVYPAEEQARKREIRLMKNREAARECRNKKKEYIKCLENRVAVLENQNKALIEELKNLKELYKSQN